MVANPPYLSVCRDSESLIEVAVASRLEAQERASILHGVVQRAYGGEPRRRPDGAAE